jgi:hypothetical protein
LRISSSCRASSASSASAGVNEGAGMFRPGRGRGGPRKRARGGGNISYIGSRVSRSPVAAGPPANFPPLQRRTLPSGKFMPRCRKILR